MLLPRRGSLDRFQDWTDEELAAYIVGHRDGYEAACHDLRWLPSEVMRGRWYVAIGFLCLIVGATGLIVWARIAGLW